MKMRIQMPVACGTDWQVNYRSAFAGLRPIVCSCILWISASRPSFGRAFSGYRYPLPPDTSSLQGLSGLQGKGSDVVLNDSGQVI